MSYEGRKVSKYGVISGPYFPVFGLIYRINLRTGKYGPEITPYLNSFHSLKAILITSIISKQNHLGIRSISEEIRKDHRLA